MNPVPARKAPGNFAKTAAAALLSLSLILPPIQAAAAEPAAAPSAAKTLNADNAKAFLDDFFAAEQTKAHYTGAAVVIVKDGEVVAQEGYGYADKENKKAVDPENTVFRIASVSKSFTAVAAMQLVEQGKLDLKADFLTYTPGLTLDNPFDQPVTVEQLLLHTTGFEIRDPNLDDLHEDLGKKVEIEDYVKTHMPPVARKPGSSYMYDNFASLLLGLVVEKASGEPFEDYMETHLFEPLGMKDSGYLPEGALKDKLAVGYGPGGQAVPPYAVTPTIMPHGGMMSTPADIGKFMIAFLSGGDTGKGRILNEQSVALMEPYRSEIHPLLPNTTYGFEAPMQLPGAGSNPAIITKAGDITGYSSLLFMIPEEDTGVFITYNQLGALRQLFYPQFIATFFPQYAAPAELPDDAPATPDDLARYDGYYADLRQGIFITRLQSGESAGALQWSSSLLGEGQFKPVGDNLFVDEETGLFAAFQLDEQGQVAYMKEPYINPYSYTQKGAEAAGFEDLDADHPYAYAVLPLQSLGYYPNDGEGRFLPDQAVTRAAYVQRLLTISGLDGSPTEAYAFTDISGHPAAAYIQQAYELGMVSGDGQGSFAPERAITRQEAAVMFWRLMVLQYPAELFDDVPLTGATAPWAVQAVQMMVQLGLHGPEVTFAEDGAADYRSLEPLTRAQEAAFLYGIFTQPTDIIVAELTAAKAESDAGEKTDDAA
ncbi:hypothetical protein PA598K_05761 [Paenibacillus sp. 598K]|uniref:serine hydrolase n=1 Tax=Paenibacillus sp. 598K TaxID=1117987 RepID=UPI000FFAC8E0|nr:serine hydrolase [Paenibacillus sp. 598K]GBF77225.1 hypothetical protein PA598K_05761 [Paenibacillus sp. 598K]